MIRGRRVFRMGAALLLAAVAVMSDPWPAAAQQYGSTYWYRNPRTGQTTGFSTNYGRCGTSTTLFYGGSGYAYQSTSGYGNGHVWGGYGYQSPRYGGGMRWRQ